MHIVIENDGTVRCLYDEALDLAQLGNLQIQRGYHVESDQHGRWLADMSPVESPLLGPFNKRSGALAAEAAWLTSNWLQV